jgi:hypothetical protein
MKAPRLRTRYTSSLIGMRPNLPACKTDDQHFC